MEVTLGFSFYVVVLAYPYCFLFSRSKLATESVISLFESPFITFGKVNGKNYLPWFAFVETWFLDQEYQDHLEQDRSHMPTEKVEVGNKQISNCILLWQLWPLELSKYFILFWRKFKTFIRMISNAFIIQQTSLPLSKWQTMIWYPSWLKTN